MIRALRRFRAAVLTVGLVATSALFVVAAPTAARASGCGSDDVAVVVNFSHWGGSAQVGCAGWSSSLTGLSALQRAGFDLTGTARYGLAFVCRIDGHPAAGSPDHENCQQTPSATKYWSYWHANPGQTSWSYSTLGVSSYHPHPGGADAWTFGGGSAPPFSPAAVLPARPSAPTHSPTPRSTAPRSADPPGHTPRATVRTTAVPPLGPGEASTPARSAGKATSAGGSPSATGSGTPTGSSTPASGTSTATTPGSTTSATGPASGGSTGAGGSLTCTSTSTASASSECGTPAIVANTSSGTASPAKASGSPVPTIAGIVIVAALAAGGGGYAWRRRAGTHGD